MGSTLYASMPKCLFFLLSCFYVIIVRTNSSSSMQPQCHGDESSALLQFKDSFIIDKFASDDPSAYPKVESWKLEGEYSDCCSWYGVKCDEITGRVIGLDLSSSFLYGAINSSSSLFSLVHLQRLSLADNHFNYSEIPSRIRHLSRLTSLNLSSSAFFGQIPLEILELSNLASLDLSDNLDPSYLLKLENPSLKTLVQNLTNLKELHLSSVNIYSPVPDILENLSSMTGLALDDCGLYGEFPRGFFLLPQLQTLDVGINTKLTGHLPEFHNSSSLKYLALDRTNFSGNLPSEYFRNWNAMIMVNVEKLTYMQASSTILVITAERPRTHMPVLWELSENYSYSIIMHNKGTQRLYEKIQTAFVAVDLSNNKFSGEIPESLGSLKGLQLLDLSNNNLTGGIPSSLAKMAGLESLDLSENMLSGEIPQQLTQLTFLAFLNVSHNHLTGPIPRGKQFDTFENISYHGNSELCGNPLSKLCGNPKASPPPPSSDQHSDDSEFPSGVDWIVIFMGYGGGLIVGLVIGHTLTTKYHEWFVDTFGWGLRK